MSQAEGATYEGAGVSLEKADTFLGAMLQWIQKTEEIPGAGLRPLIPNGYYASVVDIGLEVGLALATDGVGTKILVAELANDYSGIGHDCIAMNVNDLICVGARPLAMLDYLAIQDPPIEVGEQLGRSLYEASKLAGICIPGGELAQLPEMIKGVRDGQGIDLAGAAFGLVNKSDISHGQGLSPGDVLIGIASNGVHSNGFTLARNVVFQRAGLKVSDKPAELEGRSVGEELLRPTAIYVRHLNTLRDKGLFPKAAMHITGGGFLNLLRASTDNITYVLDQPIAIPPVFRWLQELGSVSDEEMHRVFNMGVGMVLVVEQAKVDETLAALKEVEPSYAAQRVGHLDSGTGKSVQLPSRGLISANDKFQKA